MSNYGGEYKTNYKDNLALSLIAFIISVHKLINLLSHLLSTATVRKDGAPSVRFVFPKSKCNMAREQGRVFGTFRYINENTSFLKYHLSTLKLKQVIKKLVKNVFPPFSEAGSQKIPAFFSPSLVREFPPYLTQMLQFKAIIYTMLITVLKMDSFISQ